MANIALIPGGFKPPTIGHFHVVDEISKRPEIDKIIVLIGQGSRDNINSEQSLSIWNIYKKYLKQNIEIYISKNPSPVKDVLDTIKNNPDNFYYPVVGYRNEDDEKDLNRFNSLSKNGIENFKTIVIKGEPGVSGTKARKEISDNNFEGFQKYIPIELNMEERKRIWSILTQDKIEENDLFGLKSAIKEIFENKGIEPIIFTDKKHNYKKSFSHKLYDTLNEITLNTSNAVSVIGNEYKGEFDIDGATYEYIVQKFDKIFDDGLLYNISFSPKGIEIDVPMGTTSPQNFIKILSTMYKVILDFIEKVKPKYLGISSKDNGEDKNYHMLYNRLTSNNNIPGYFKKNPNLNFTTPNGYSGRIIVLKKKSTSSEPNIPLNEGQLTDRQLLLGQIKSLTEYMIDKGMNIQPLPKLKIIDDDEDNASDFFGKTAYYDPKSNIIVLYTNGRHDKDCCRSYSHEMIHHIQNNEGRLNNITHTNTNEDDNLLELEKEAYLEGNIIFRNWTDSLQNPKQLNEGRYDKITTMISGDILKKWKKDFNEGKSRSILDTFYESGDIYVKVIAKMFFIDSYKKYRVDGSMSDSGDVLIVDFKIDPSFLPNFWEDISMDLKDVVRHEIEHATQTSHRINSRAWKYMEDDTLARKLINAKLLDRTNYFKLKKEVDANLQGLYLKAKKSKQPFAQVINTYLDNQSLTPEQKEEIINTWRPRAKVLSLPQI
jgi:nicotinic acid mononucleotide adenylyltransferase